MIPPLKYRDVRLGVERTLVRKRIGYAVGYGVAGGFCSYLCLDSGRRGKWVFLFSLFGGFLVVLPRSMSFALDVGPSRSTESEVTRVVVDVRSSLRWTRPDL